jgi:hypothetical protein
MEKSMKKAKDLSNKYEKKQDKLIVMDDYDGGQRSILDLVVDDLKTLDEVCSLSSIIISSVGTIPAMSNQSTIGKKLLRRQIKEKSIKKIKDLLNKYEKKLDKLIVMDDYGGGQRNILDLVVDDLKTLDKYVEMEKYPHQDNHMD